MKNGNRTYRREELRSAALFSAPLTVTVLVFVFIPVFGTIAASFYRRVTFLPDLFVGTENFLRLFHDEHFLSSLSFTISFVVVSVFFELIIGLAGALLLNERFAGRKVFRIVLLLPWAVPIAVSGRLWQMIYNNEYGIFNAVVTAVGFAPVNWLGSPSGAFWSLVLSDVWKTSPFMIMILLAGLSTIPKELYEQAVMDGASFVQRLVRVTLPLLLPVVVVALLFRTIDAIRIFDLIYVLTGGGPGGSTASVSMYAFTAYLGGDFGYGSAVSVVLFLAAGALAVVYLKLGRFGTWDQ
jgi:multiple sugar transport system permease protein